MKKMFVVLAAGALAGCTTWQNMFPRQPEREEQAPRPAFRYRNALRFEQPL